MIETAFSRNRCGFVRGALPDLLAAATLLALPWSTSATSVLLATLAIVLLLTTPPATMQRLISNPIIMFAILLWALACISMIWSAVGWEERFRGLRGFHKLMLLPLLLLHFRRSSHASKVLACLFISVIFLQFVSWFTWLWPTFLPIRDIGVPVKDTIYQGMFFALFSALFIILSNACWNDGQKWRSGLFLLIAATFVLNLVFVANSRTSLVVFPFLLAIVCAQIFGRRGLFGCFLVILLAAPIAWSYSPYLRARLSFITEHLERPSADTTAHQRIMFWRESASAIMQAPVLGHGTGSFEHAIRKFGRVGADLVVTRNPHNQTFFIGVQFGLVGIFLLYFMWLSHLLYFPQHLVIGRLATLFVVQNIISSFFNSHLNDFTAGWLYILGVGILGGMVLQEKSQKTCHHLMHKRPSV